MKKPTDKDAFIVLAPTGKSKVFAVAARRIGSRDRYSVVATCQSETLCQRIVDGLDLLQGKEVKLDIPVQRVLDGVRAQLSATHAANAGLRAKLRAVEDDKREVKFETDKKIRGLEYDLKTARRELELARPAVVPVTAGASQ